MFHVSLGGGGFVFQTGGFIFKWGVPHEGASVLMGEGFEKNCWIVEASPHAPPLWETLGYHLIVYLIPPLILSPHSLSYYPFNTITHVKKSVILALSLMSRE